MELTERQQQAISDGRKTLGQVLRTRYPEDYPRLWAIAITSVFVEMCAGPLPTASSSRSSTRATRGRPRTPADAAALRDCSSTGGRGGESGSGEPVS